MAATWNYGKRRPDELGAVNQLIIKSSGDGVTQTWDIVPAVTSCVDDLLKPVPCTYTYQKGLLKIPCKLTIPGSDNVASVHRRHGEERPMLFGVGSCTVGDQV